MTSEFPHALTGPSSKERKYDRQLRLWAASGQQALEESRVLLVNSDGPWGNRSTGVSGVVGVETLKNLVLPGVGGFTIVDPAVVTEPDLGVNFFLENESLGRSRAEETCRLLKELNPDVEGSFRTKVYLPCRDKSASQTPHANPSTISLSRRYFKKSPGFWHNINSF
jgi:amyloid beta precursor protein binding protein 1